jgi:hypothetical protein
VGKVSKSWVKVRTSAGVGLVQNLGGVEKIADLFFYSLRAFKFLRNKMSYHIHIRKPILVEQVERERNLNFIQ